MPSPKLANTDDVSPMDSLNITIIGAGTIGLSFAALHVSNASHQGGYDLRLVVYDTRPDLEDHVLQTLPRYIKCTFIRLEGAESSSYSITTDDCGSTKKLIFQRDLAMAVSGAHIVQEQGPENMSFKTELWPTIEQCCPVKALLWSSTSGIPASIQSQKMRDPSRLIVVHPYNPPHIMPLLEIVPSPRTNSDVISRTFDFWKSRDRMPLVLKKETTGFVANRLAFALLREAIYLVKEGVASVEEIDDLMTSSLGPRWAVAGVFKSYHAGGGPDGLEGFFRNIGKTVQACWDDAGQVNIGEGWEVEIFRQSREAYANLDLKDRDQKTRNVLRAAELS